LRCLWAAITSSDVAGCFDIITEAARQKLARLVDRGELERRESGRT
jgi:predicted ArsR family transcriptional regulator